MAGIEMSEAALRAGIVETAKGHRRGGLLPVEIRQRLGAAGRDGFLITAVGALPYARMTPETSCIWPPMAACCRAGAPRREWPFHAAIYAARADAQAIVHTHSPRATATVLREAGNPGVPLHDRAGRRRRHPLRAVCHLRQSGACRQRGRGAGRPQGRAARQSRRDRAGRRCRERR